MKKILFGLIGSILLLSACSKDEAPKIKESDKWFVTGEATYYTAKNDVSQLSLVDFDAEKSGGLTDSEYVIGNFAFLKKGKTLFIESEQGTIKYGGSNPTTIHVQNNTEKPILGYKYELTDGGAGITVDEDGMYYIVFNTSLKELTLVHVNWGLIGDATGGWSDELSLGAATYNNGVVTWEKTQVKLTADPLKFRYGGDWGIKFKLDEATEVVAFSDITGTKPEAENIFNDQFQLLQVGGKNLKMAEAGVYTVTLTYTIADGTYKAKAVKTGDFVAEYPDNLYYIGADFGNWDWASNQYGTMIQTGSANGKFWALIYSNGGEFKFSPKTEWSGDFGVTGQATATLGTFDKGGDNIKVPAPGIYQIVVDLTTNKITIEEPNVYLLGSTVGGLWGADAFIPANKFTVDNAAGTLVSPAFTADGEVRICMRNEFLPDGDWWKAEFIVLNGQIVYRGKGGDQERVQGAVGQKVTLNIQNGTGTIQ